MLNNNQDAQNTRIISPLLIDTDELARLISMSKKWVADNRHRILGAQKVGGRWRFNAEIIHRAILTGKNIVKKGRF